MREPFAWGERDCSLWPASWIAEVRGADPAAGIRGRYRTELGAARLIKREGGHEALARRLAATAGLAETGTPMAGDVGLVETERGLVTMLALGPVWAWKAREGVLYRPARPLVAWSV